MENVRRFFEELIKTEEAKAIFDSLEKPENEEETICAYVKVAEKLGIELSKEEIMGYLSSKLASGEVNDEELSQLTGGGENSNCRKTFTNEENCWWNDGCDLVFFRYDEYLCYANYYNYRDGKYVQVCSQSFYG